MEKSVVLQGTISASGRNAGDGPTCGDGDGSGWYQNRSFLGSKKNDPSWKLLAILAIPSYLHEILVVPSIFSLQIP